MAHAERIGGGVGPGLQGEVGIQASSADAGCELQVHQVRGIDGGIVGHLEEVAVLMGDGAQDAVLELSGASGLHKFRALAGKLFFDSGQDGVGVE